MENTTQTLIDKLHVSIENPRLYKQFDFSMEELSDNPEIILKIVEYLEMHKDKITDFSIHTWTDSETFHNIIMLEVIPNEEYIKYMQSAVGNNIITTLNKNEHRN